MKNRYRMFRRRGGVYYLQDSATGKQESLRTMKRAEAESLLGARNTALQQPLINLEIAKAYLMAADPRMAERTWEDVMGEYATHGRPSSQERSRRMALSRSLDPIRKSKLIETRAEDLLDLLRRSGSATHNYLRRYHNLALKLGWLPRPVLYPALWPKLPPTKRRAATREEFDRIITVEANLERRAYYQLLWETGAAQTDGALIRAEDVDWERNVLFYQRKKLRADSPPCALALGPTLSNLLKDLPGEGFLFPRIARETSNQRSAEFCRRCRTLKIKGISLHSFRYSWAERACGAGIPERYAQAALGHASKAVHRAYARGAMVICPAPN
ncbi:MAG: tyrosine-type recombinase/integrase [Chthoniobacterales bacterium]|nr:tyrosine-type recombinase/integrase [Chthoniobacterales bacterium]